MDAIAKMPTYEAYKDSGVEWLGEVPSHWKSYPLCAKSNLKSVSNNENEELLSVYLDRGVIKFDEVDAKRTNVTSLDLSKYQLVEPGDFVLNNQQAWRGSVGISKYRGIVSPAYLILSISQDISPEFGNYLFRDGAMVANYLVCSKGVGTIQRNLYWPQLKRTLLFYPSLEEQTLIANFLDQKTAQIDEAIAIKEQQIALLKERKQIIIQKAVTQGLDPDVPMKDSGVDWIGEIPAHWSYEPIKYSLNGIVDCEHKTAPFVDDQEYFVVRTTNVKDGKLSLDGAKYTTEQGYKEWTRRGVPVPGDILLTREAPAGEACLVPSGMKICLGQRMVWLKVRGDRLLPDFIISLIYSTVGRTYIDFLSSGSTVLHFNMADINNIPVLIPQMAEQRKLVDYIAKVTEESERVIELQKEQISKLKEYKTTLINSAVTGKIRITPEMVA
ncbi:MAG: restriction endonuclease subunit S [Pseudomonadota bacterium]|nr:restriction endonuclease subunit S [Pseudomonadota bacterium]